MLGGRPISQPLFIFFLLLIVFLSPYTLWINIYRGCKRSLKLSTIGNALRSSTLYVIAAKYIIPGFNKDNTNSIYNDDEAEFAYLRSVIRSERSRIGSMGPGWQCRENTGLKEEAHMSMVLAVKHQANGRHNMALKLLKHAVELDPQNAIILNLLGEAFEKLSAPNGSQILVASGWNFLESAENIVSAEAWYTKALISDPMNNKAQSNRQRTSPIVDKVDQQRFHDIDMKVAQFYSVPESNSGLRKAKIEHYFQHIYHSNAIEGNTLSLAQTRAVLETRLAVGGKSLQEQNEVLGMDAAFRYLNTSLLRGISTPITLSDILELHRRVLSFVDITEAGRLRQTQVFIAEHVPPKPELLPDLMLELVDWINYDEAATMHPIELAALAHWKLVFIHPFYDGNGRTARLLMNLLLMRAGLPPAIIRKEDRHFYYETIKTANMGDVRPFIRFIANCAEKTIDDYLNAAFVPDSKDKPDRAIIPSEQLPSLPSSNPLIQYAPILHFPWISPHSAQHTAQEVHEDIIYSA